VFVLSRFLYFKIQLNINDITSSEGVPAELFDTTCLKIGQSSEETPEDRQYRETMDYWLEPALPNANVIMDGIHWRIMNTIVPAYNRFVSLGSAINKQLEEEFNVSL